MTSISPSSIFSHQIHCINHRGRYQKPSTTSHHVIAVWSILWQERVVPIVHAHLTLNLNTFHFQPLSSSNSKVDQVRNIFFLYFVLICLWMIFFFFKFLNNLEFVVFGDYWALFLWLLVFLVLILWLWWDNSLMHRVYKKKNSSMHRRPMWYSFFKMKW